MDSEEQSAKKGNKSSQVERDDGEQDSTHHDVDGGSHPPRITQQQPLQKSFEKDAKVREKNLRLAQASAPPPPPSITLTSSVNSDGAGTNTRDSNKSSSGDHGTSKRKVAGANSLTSSINSAEDQRNSLQCSASRHAAKTAKAQTNNNNTRRIPAGRAVRVSTGNPSEDDVDEEQGPVATLTAKAVDDGEEDRIIRQLQEDKEALQRQVQIALEGERKAREEMQIMTRAAPTANVAVVMGDAATSVVSEEPPPSESQPIAREGQRERCYTNACKGTVLITACCCLSCIILVVVLVFTLGLDRIIRIPNATDTTSDEVTTKRSNLEELLQEFQPLHEYAFDWLVDSDQWQPNLDSIFDGVSNQGEPSTIGTGGMKWMFVERYYLAVLYFSTKGSNWKKNYGWLSEENSHCDKGAKRWFGIECDENDSLISIELRACRCLVFIVHSISQSILCHVARRGQQFGW